LPLLPYPCFEVSPNDEIRMVEHISHPNISHHLTNLKIINPKQNMKAINYKEAIEESPKCRL
jgi:hypothetical protein